MMSKSEPQARKKYLEIKLWVLEGLFDDQRTAIKTAQTFDKIRSLHSIAESYERVFEHLVENLMLVVVLSIIGSDCEHSKRIHWLSSAKDILNKCRLEDLMNDLSEEEKFDLLIDLKALKLVA